MSASIRHRIAVLTILCAWQSPAIAEDASAPPVASPAEPQIEQLDESRYRIGKVTFDQKTREIRMPAKVNMAEGLLEFLLVQQHGKVHESLLVTDASPTHLNLAFTLLRFPASGELFPELDETGHPTGGYPEVPAAVKTGARIRIDVEWMVEGKAHRNPINEWIRHSQESTVMPAGPWVYTGSALHQGKFIPELTGDIAAIFVARAAMINYPGNDNGSDLVWYAFPGRVPAKNTAITLIITPFANAPIR